MKIGLHCFHIVYSTEFSIFFISSIISLCSLNRLFTETNSSGLVYESIKALEIRPSIVFYLSFPNNTILSCFFFFFFMIDLYLLIPEVIAQILIPTTELVISTGLAANEANAEIETQTVTVGS